VAVPPGRPRGGCGAVRLERRAAAVGRRDRRTTSRYRRRRSRP
jgi:hypothetical protein